MNKKLNDLLIIDQEIGDFLYKNNDLNDNELSVKFEESNFVNKALKILSKLSNKNVFELLKRSRYLNTFIDIKKFIKKYPINKTYLKENKDMYIEEYHKLHNMCLYISSISNDYKEFNEYMNILDVDNIECYLLNHMSNEQIYFLSNETTDWSQKLYYFSFLKRS